MESGQADFEGSLPARRVFAALRPRFAGLPVVGPATGQATWNA